MSDQRPEWMMRAAEEIEPNDSPVEAEREFGRERLERIADIIARHAPDPAKVPIGPGDVVQVVEDYITYPRGMTLPYSKSEVQIVTGTEPGYFFVGECKFPLHVAVCIGRARYWPDGSPVEGGGE